MCDNMVKEIKMSAEEAIEYVREKVREEYQVDLKVEQEFVNWE